VTGRLTAWLGWLPRDAATFFELDHMVLADVALLGQHCEDITHSVHPLARASFFQIVVAIPAGLLRRVPDSEVITNQGRLLTLLNQRELGARRGLIISGGAATGKTTAIKQLGRFHELRTHARFPGNEDRIPVVYVTAPPKGSPRKLAMEFARFLGLPTLNPRMNVTDISDTVCQVLIDARTDIVVVDEIHNLNLDTRAGEERSDHLKYFTEHLPATFVYAGIDAERSGLFTGT
jgi:hypothetical protein